MLSLDLAMEWATANDQRRAEIVKELGDIATVNPTLQALRLTLSHNNTDVIVTVRVPVERSAVTVTPEKSVTPLIRSFSDKARSLLETVADMRKTRLLNTAKRRREHEQRLKSARKLEYEARLLSAIVDALQSGTLAPALQTLTTYAVFRIVVWFEVLPTHKTDVERLTRHNLHTEERYNAARKALADFGIAVDESADALAMIEIAIADKSIPGFFPTPTAIANWMVEHVEIEQGDSVLEPSAGDGALLAAVRRVNPDCKLDAIEVHPALCELLTAKGFAPQQLDFLDFFPTDLYSIVMMNPPFEARTGVGWQDIAHVRHAYENCLAADGVLVSIVSRGSLQRKDNQSTAFQEWLSELGAEINNLPNGAFSSSGTSVNTSLIVLEKPNA